MTYLAAILAAALAFLLGLSLGVRRPCRSIFLDVVTGRRIYMPESVRAAHEATWRELERVDSV